jgi:TPR repeat protein
MDGPARVPGTHRRPEEAVRWFRKAAALHRHIVATYELGVAHYTGDGMNDAPDPGHALRLFQQAAHLGHSGAAYMLGECLLDGVGCDRDRASALEWLLTAAELGHGLARERALMVLLEDHEQLLKEAASVEHVEAGRRSEAIKWLAGQSEEAAVINLERRHTIGGGGGGVKVPSRSSAVRERRQSKVRESRDGSGHLFPPTAPTDVRRSDGSTGSDTTTQG